MYPFSFLHWNEEDPLYNICKLRGKKETKTIALCMQPLSFLLLFVTPLCILDIHKNRIKTQLTTKKKQKQNKKSKTRQNKTRKQLVVRWYFYWTCLRIFALFINNPRLNRQNLLINRKFIIALCQTLLQLILTF